MPHPTSTTTPLINALKSSSADNMKTYYIKT